MKMIIDEAGVLTDSEMYIFNPSMTAARSLVHVSFWGNYHCSVPYQIKRENYDSLLLFFIQSGVIELTYNGQTQLLKPGCVQIIDCMKPQHYRALGDIHFIWMHFTGGSSQALYDHLEEVDATGFAVDEQPGLAREINLLIQQLVDAPTNEWAVNLAFTRLMTRIAEKSERQTWEHDLVAQAHAYMTEHFQNPLQLSDIARTFNVSTCHFARLFRRQYKISPHDYLISLRISEAKRRLLLTKDSVEAIAGHCGFNSTSHFIRSFGQRTGKTPAQYRKMKF